MTELKYLKDIAKSLDGIYKELRKMNAQKEEQNQKFGEWISVSERLPEDEQEILFSTKTGRVYSGKYHDDDSANQWYSHRDKCRAWNNVVSAWMPLPKPYKSEGSETKQGLAYADQETMMPAT